MLITIPAFFQQLPNVSFAVLWLREFHLNYKWEYNYYSGAYTENLDFIICNINAKIPVFQYISTCKYIYVNDLLVTLHCNMHAQHFEEPLQGK